MKITIAICTYNRARLLRTTLETLTALVEPEEAGWAVLVVDNNSTDATPDVLDAFEGRLPLRAVREERQGLSHARNRAVEEMEGDYVIWLDDDVKVTEPWLAAYARAFRQHPEAAFFGGPILPWFEGTPPEWLRIHFDLVRGVYSCKRPDPTDGIISDPTDIPFGANVAFPAEVQRRHPYNPELGRKGQSLRGGEEAEIILRLLKAGETGRWVGDATVRHFIAEESQNPGYVRRLLRTHAYCQILRDQPETRPTAWNRPAWAWRGAVEYELRYRWARLFGDADSWLPLLKKAAHSQGVVMAPWVL